MLRISEEALPTVEPLKAIDEAKLRLMSLPDKPARLPRTIKSRQEEEDTKMRDGKGGADEKQHQDDDVGSKGSRAVPRKQRGMVSAVVHKGSSKKSRKLKQGPRSSSSKNGGGMRLRGGAPDAAEGEISSVVSEDSSSVVSSSSSSAFALPVSTKPPAAKQSTAAHASKVGSQASPKQMTASFKVEAPPAEAKGSGMKSAMFPGVEQSQVI